MKSFLKLAGIEYLCLQDHMPTGKYQGNSIQFVVDTNPGHILWLNQNGLMHFTKQVLVEAQRMNRITNKAFLEEDVPQ